MHKVQNAIIVAAGKGERMLPLTAHTPKPLLKVHGKPMIENTIELLLQKGITEIYVVVGYLAEQFNYLEEKYGIHLVLNRDYDTCNNISSLYYAREHLGNSIVLDADIWIINPDVLLTSFEYSGYTSVWTQEYSDEWIQTVDENGFLVDCQRGGNNGWILYSISYWSCEDCERLKRHLETEYDIKKNRQIYWDDIPVFCYPDEYSLQIKKSNRDMFMEFDCINELAEYDSSYHQYL